MTASKPVIDPLVIANLRTLNSGDTDDFLREIVGLFFADMPVRIAELERGLGGGDPATFIRAAHSIKGSASSLGANSLRALAAKIEERAQKGGTPGLGPMVADLKEESARTIAALQEILKAGPP